MKEIEEIEYRALRLLVNVIPYESRPCLKLGCCDKNHLHQINQLLDIISWSVHVAAEYASKTKRHRSKSKVIPGWNRNFKSLHNIARINFLNWMRCGRIQDSEEFRKINNGRKAFNPFASIGRTGTSNGKVKVMVICLNISFMT